MGGVFCLRCVTEQKQSWASFSLKRFLLVFKVKVSVLYRIHERQKRLTAQRRKGEQDEWSPIVIQSASSSSINRDIKTKKKKKKTTEKECEKELEHLYTVNK